MPPANVWFKSSYSSAASNTCVEVRFTDDGVGVRDTKRHAAGTHQVSAGIWQAFIVAVKGDRFGGTPD